MSYLQALTNCHRISGVKAMLLAAVLASSILLSPLWAQSAMPSRQDASPVNAGAGATAGTSPKPATSTAATYKPSMTRRELEYYGIYWGIDSLNVKEVESCELIRFTWRVLDGGRAKPLNDETVDPYLIDPAVRAKLIVPELPFMGKMRVKTTPETGKTSWVAFSNPGHVVKKGDRVNVVIGPFHVDGLLVE